ncbi:hypothetical protein SND54_00480, partial [Escherichia coli]|nr:hypothetical protein [Escherichia coli]
AKRFRIGVEGATTDGREIQREWFTDLLTPVKSTSAELQSAAAMGRRFGEALAEGLNMVMHPLDSLKSGVSWLLE